MIRPLLLLRLELKVLLLLQHCTLSKDDDVYSVTVSDGTQSYTASNIIVDIDDSTSTNNFGNALTEAFLGSGINVTMDTGGNVFFRRRWWRYNPAIVYQLLREKWCLDTRPPGKGHLITLLVEARLQVLHRVTTTSSSSSSGGSSGTSTNSGTSIANMSIGTQTGANSAITTIDAAISYVQAERSNLGAIQNRLTYTVDNLTNAMTNAASARSRVLDTDYAKETAELARAQIIQQAATAMLAQANQQPQIVLALLQ